MSVLSRFLRHAGRSVYQLGADLHLFDIRSGKDRPLEVRLASDFEHQRQRWVKKPTDFLTSMHLSDRNLDSDLSAAPKAALLGQHRARPAARHLPRGGRPAQGRH